MSKRPVSLHAARNSRNLAHIRQVSLNGGRSSENVLASLRATQILGTASKSVLPAELMVTILEYLPVPDLIRCAQASRRLQEMVYDDTRWVQKLRAIGVWSDSEARQRVEEAMKRKTDVQRTKEADTAKRKPGNSKLSANDLAAIGAAHSPSVTLFDASAEESKYRQSLEQEEARASRRRATLADGFDELTISSPSSPRASHKGWDSKAALTVLSRSRSARGYARQEFGKIYAALNPLYIDLTVARGHSDALVFRAYRDPEQQAQVLSSLERYSRCDLTQGSEQRRLKLESITGVFENAVLHEFQQGLTSNDVDGRMRRYAHVLVSLNEGSACIDSYISHLPSVARDTRMGNPLECLESVAPGHVDLNPARMFFEKLANEAVEQADIIDRVFPPSVDVLTPFLSRLCEDVISGYLTTLFDETHSTNTESYVKAVAGTYEQALRFVATLKRTKASPPDLTEKVIQMLAQCYEKHVDLYLAEELAVFKSKADEEVSQWERTLSEQEASAESFFMSNVNRQAAKRDFMSSFKKVVMMPVSVLPVMSSPFATTKTPAPIKSPANLDSIDTSYGAARSRSSTIAAGTIDWSKRPGTPQSSAEAPTNELAAKAAIMNSRLEGIKTLFSIEVALNLTHLAKASIERAAAISHMGSVSGDDAKKQCGNIFVALLHILGDRHVRTGFDKAVNHLGGYNPQQVREFRAQSAKGEGMSDAQAVGVEPLVTFLELVNVGDLIQQMIDVFYAQELVGANLIAQDDFLDPAVKGKKRFEQMLDDRVAAGLNKGIDVLMDEVEFICATTQVATDFNPGAIGADKNGTSGIVDIGTSATARQVVDMVGSHTSMLVGSTDKNMLDVFTQEVGLRLFGVLCKHFKRQRISVDGSIKLISDINHYSAFISTLRQKPLQPYFQALRELAQIYLVHIEPPTNLFTSNSSGKRGSLLSSKGSKTAAQAKELATIIADTQRYHGIFGAEEVYEFAQRRADWYLVRGDVERAMYGVGCSVM